MGIRSSVFWANHSFFEKKWANERFVQKNEWFAHLLIFGERPERIAHGLSFVVCDLSDLLTSIIFGELPELFAHIAHQKWGNERIAHFFKEKTYINLLKNKILDFIANFFEQIAHGRSLSFLVSDLSDSLTLFTKNEGMSESLIFLKRKNVYKTYKKIRF